MKAKHWIIGLVLSLTTASGGLFATAQAFTVLDKTKYQQTVKNSRSDVIRILSHLKSNRTLSEDEKIAEIVNEFLNKPYLSSNAMGEGDWQPHSLTYQSGAIHIKQNPVYRLDAFDCQTFVQVAMALLIANSLNEFDQTILKIAYGAAHNPNGNIVRYYNRNHFVDADFNSINQKNNWLQDVTAQGVLAQFSKSQTVNITRNQWLEKQLADHDDHVQVLSYTDGKAMVNRFKTVYRDLPFPSFTQQKIKIHYLPKFQLIKKTIDGRLIPNKVLFDRIPTPAIIENVRDVNHWKVMGRKVKDIIGSELSISHMGILYRHTFKQGEIIHYNTMCQDKSGRAVCEVTPILCQKNTCRELMIAHATNQYPSHFLWYKQNGRYVCSPTPPQNEVSYTTCDRVISQPFFDYLTDKQFNGYWMAVPSFLGVHIEKMISKNSK